MDKRQRLENTILGETTDRVPVAAWRHWPGDNERAADLASATLAFQQMYDWDLMLVYPASTYAVADYGARAQWDGRADGDTTLVKPAINRSLEWTELRPLDPSRGELGKYLEAIRLTQAGWRADDTPILAVIYSPLAQAVRMTGGDTTIRTLRTHPDRVRTGLNVITETTLGFIDALKQLGVDGIYYIIEQADYHVLSEAEYAAFGVPYDRKILEALPPRFWFNMVQIRGKAPMLDAIGSYGVQAIHWDTVDSRTDMQKGRAVVRGAICGGLSTGQHCLFGTPTIMTGVAREVLASMDRRRLILAPGDAVPVSTPLSNLRALRDVVAAGVV